MRHIKGAATAALLVLSSQSVAREMVVISATLQTEAKSVVLMDADTIREVSGYKRAWIWIGMKFPKEDAKVISELLEFDCPQERSRVLKSAFYKLDHSHIMDGDPEAWEFPTPSTQNYEVLAVACGIKKTGSEQSFGDSDPFEMIGRFMAAK